MLLQFTIFLILVICILSGIICAMKWSRKEFEKFVRLEANEKHPTYVLHAMKVNGLYYDIPSLALLYELKPHEWIPINDKIPKEEWNHRYGKQAIHLFPLPPGESYKNHLRDRHYGKPIDYSGITVELIHTITVSGRIRYVLNTCYFLPGTNVVAFDLNNRVLNTELRVVGQPYPRSTNHVYSFNKDLPIGTRYLRRLIDVKDQL